MKKITICGVSMGALLAANGAMAAGYTCEELIEYTSCQPGYYLGVQCPDGYEHSDTVCEVGMDYITTFASAEECENDMGNAWLGAGCFNDDWDHFIAGAKPGECHECPAGSSCAGDTAYKQPCAAGTYQPNTKQTSCITTPQGNFSGAGAINYVACPSTGLTDINGTVVPSTTLSTGATSVAECIIGNGVQFKDNKGIYHFKSNCEYSIPTFAEACAAYKAEHEDTDCSVDRGTCDNTASMSPLLYEPATGEVFCDWNQYLSLEEVKTACVQDGGQWNLTEFECMCPGGTRWEAIDGSGAPDGVGGWGCW